MSDNLLEGDGEPSGYASVVGARLRTVRRQKRLSLQAVEAASAHEFKASVLGAYERGERAISVPRLQRLARLYEVPVDQLLPDNLADGLGNGTRSPQGGQARGSDKVRIDLTKLKDTTGPEAAALQRFLATIQVERQDFNGQVLTVRGDDMRVIGATLGLGTTEMVERLDELGLLHRP
ncbi:MAG: helix-turn-helix domain protein [Acidimicrobiaceae bacterium]|jgi:transcriptional regulator with XRE-family HTH domain|nr:helix-turn-helix domain protein [Acidimicrobiaceae bacterium]